MGGDGTSRARARDWIDFDDVAARDGGALRAVVKRARGDGETAGDEDARGRFLVDF